MENKKQRVLIRRGLKRTLPKAAPLGEMLLCIDNNSLYVGTGSDIKLVAKSDTVYDGGNFDDAPAIAPKYADGGNF